MLRRSGMQMGLKNYDRGRLGDINRKRKRDETYVSPVVKWLMFTFNLLFCIIGCAFIAIGIWAHVVSQDSKTRSGHEITGVFDIFFDIAVLFMTFGSLVFFIALFGMLGALRENICLLKTFFSWLIIIFLIEVGSVISVFALSDSIKIKLQEILKVEAIEEYRTDIDRVNFIDWFQETFECCGVGDEGWRIWESNRYFNCSSPGFEACSVPYSCCRDPYSYDAETINSRCGAGMLVEDITEAEASNTIYTNGCVDAAILAIQDNMLTIGAISIGILVPQLFGICMVRILWGQIEDQMNR